MMQWEKSRQRLFIMHRLEKMTYVALGPEVSPWFPRFPPSIKGRTPDRDQIAAHFFVALLSKGTE
jgi:hypothetical protein